MATAEALLRYPLFAVLGVGGLSAWLESGEVMTVQTGETLLQEGTPGQHVWLLLTGRVRVVRVLRQGKGREVPLGVFGPGEVFGEYALLPPYLNTATCRACETSSVLRLPLAPLEHGSDVLRAPPEISAIAPQPAVVAHHRGPTGQGQHGVIGLALGEEDSGGRRRRGHLCGHARVVRGRRRVRPADGVRDRRPRQ